MELPFLKNKNKEGGGTPTIELTVNSEGDTTRTPLIEGVAEDILNALDRKDFKGIKEALRAFLHQIKE